MGAPGGRDEWHWGGVRRAWGRRTRGDPGGSPSGRLGEGREVRELGNPSPPCVLGRGQGRVTSAERAGSPGAPALTCSGRVRGCARVPGRGSRRSPALPGFAAMHPPSCTPPGSRALPPFPLPPSPRPPDSRSQKGKEVRAGARATDSGSAGCRGLGRGRQVRPSTVPYRPTRGSRGPRLPAQTDRQAGDQAPVPSLHGGQARNVKSLSLRRATCDSQGRAP